ncbi:hypothetical protein KORDIASMS9_00214 [Kordia sp. SMS9]|uniref:hypothetical protein n=1 Tax=Kordia sp. SMS9 TaxID=2282170 RepID=UPI000E1011AF|nr:hypothetical protein [Kordia sp. SMS9]AXG68030.1 hypothetical protein KORDIASMS9_00214 [Kordia sp. SMS9]
MKKRIIFLLSISLLYSLQVAAQFKGSNGDGFDVESQSSITLTNLSLEILYDGSNGDGFSSRTLTATTLENISLAVLYEGSNGDGFSNRSLVATTLENISLAVLYDGSNGDGFSNRILSATTLDNTDLAVLYDGSNGDGFSLRLLPNTTLDNTDLAVLYDGSNGDGFSLRLLPATTLDNLQLSVLYEGSNGDGFDIDQFNGFLDPNQIVDLRVRAVVLLQGPILNPVDDDLMNDNLRSGNVIPKISPYDATDVISDSDVLNDGGISGVGAPRNNIVDWVWVEIRSSVDNTLIVDGTSALVQRDGDIVALDGTSDIILRGLTGNYFITVKHRNHLGVMTQTTRALSVATTGITDFTTNSTAVFGTNSRVQLSNGDMALWAGNANGDTMVQYSGTTPDSPSILSEVLNDAGNFLNFPTYVVTGYNNHDVNMDGNTQYTGTAPDTPILLQNVLAHPGNFLNFSTYQILEQLPEN